MAKTTEWTEYNKKMLDRIERLTGTVFSLKPEGSRVCLCKSDKQITSPMTERDMSIFLDGMQTSIWLFQEVK